MMSKSILKEKSYNFAVRIVNLFKFLQSEKKEYIFLRGSSTFKKNNTHHATIIVKWKNVRKLLKHIEKTIISQSALSVIFH